MFAKEPHDITASARSHYLDQINLFANWNAKVLDSTAKLISLNMQLAQDMLIGMQKMMSPENAGAALWTNPENAQAGWSNAMVYGQKLASFMLDSRNEYSRLMQECIGDGSRKTSDVLESLMRGPMWNAAGSAPLVQPSAGNAEHLAELAPGKPARDEKAGSSHRTANKSAGRKAR